MELGIRDNSEMRSKASLPEGTVTFLFTDIEGSTELLKQLGDKYAVVLADQRRILREIFVRWEGQEVDTQGDSFFVSFTRATQAVNAAVEIQRSMAEHTWPEDAEVRVRMGLHTGEPLVAEEGYVGMDVHRAARIAHVGHGGQVLLSETTTPLVMDDLPEGVTYLDLGRHRLKDIRRPERIIQLVIDRVPSEYPPLNSLEALPPDLPLDFGPVRLPTFLEGDLKESPPLFVGRKRALERLEHYLDKALEGDGQIVFVTGGPGRGKTALLDAFVRGASADHDGLLVVNGECSSYMGLGDPYAPFRNALEMLTGGVEGRWTSDRISRNGAIRLWESMPEVLQVLVQFGPDLINLFVSGEGLIGRAREAIDGGGAWMERLATLCSFERKMSEELGQTNLFEQYEDVLGEISRRDGLILVLDDMQWGDSASINLLFHLGRNLRSKRLLILCAYRPEEVAIGRRGESHPLETLLAEIKRLHGDVWINLSEVDKEEGQGFVDSYVASENNKLSPEFHQALFAHTGGHALFTVELLRDLQERGDLIQDEEGYWVEGKALDWSKVPARVEGVIEERVGRLKEDLRDSLTIGSVEGELFTAQVVARVQEVAERKLINRLSRELEKKHRLVQAQDEARVGEHYLSQYRFTHILFQRFFYNDLSQAERRTLHGEVARVLEELFEDETDAITVQLATHYSEAGDADKAIEHLQEAGDRARMIFANEEAVQFYERALAFQKEKGDDDQAARMLMKLGLTHHSSFNFERAGVAWEEGLSLWRKASESEPTFPISTAPHALRLHEFEATTVDPNKSTDGFTAMYIRQLFSGLLEAGPDNTVLPDIAKSWEVLEGGNQYQFHLREDVRWSDGTSVTSRDFEYSWKRALTLENSSIPGFFYDIKGAKAFHKGDLSDPDQVGIRSPNENTLIVELENPTSYFLHLLSNTIAFPVPRHVVERYGEDWTAVGKIVTNGPFKLVEWQPKEFMKLIRNEEYHGRFTGNLNQVEVRFSDFGDVQRADSYNADETDVFNVAPDDIDIASLSSRFSKEFVPGIFDGTGSFCFDTTRSPFNDPRVRRALVMATDRAALLAEASPWANVYSLPATGGLIPPGIPGHSPGISLEFNPREAKKLLADAGYPGGKNFPIIDVTDLSISEDLDMVWERTTSAGWKEILGIECTWEHLDWHSFLELGRTNPSMIFQYGWSADYPDPYNFLALGFPKSTGWQSDQYEELLELSRRRMDQNERIILLKQADKLLMEEAPIFPIVYFGTNYLVKPWVRRFLPTWKDVIIDPH
jgi:ABC-type oligopeptide transport system substrate-binding subunit/class 3 adenylate cyclase